MSEITIDFDGISKELKIRQEILVRLINSFAIALTGKMKNLKEALERMDAETMRAILHEIKGTAGNLRLKRLSEAEDVMHVAVKAGEQKPKLEEYYKTLNDRVIELQEYLKK